MGYGNLTLVKTSGASDHTAGAYREGLRGGVKASEEMASDDLENMKKYKTIIINVAKKHAVDPAVIAGIISRESEAGHSISDTKPPGWGDNFKAFGLMQVDVTPNGGGHTPRGAWHSEEHLDQATEILVEFIERIQNKFPGWTREQQLKGGIAAYNMGDGNVHTYSKVDENTTGKDYSNDVVARAKWYHHNLFKVGFVEATKAFFWPF